MPLQPAPRPPLADLTSDDAGGAPEDADANPPTALGLPPQRPEDQP